MTFTKLQIEGLSETQNIEVEDRLQKILCSWEGTQHMDGQQSKGKGVDCVRFVSAVLDELGGTKTDIIHLPRDTAFHQRATAMSGMRLFIKQFGGYSVPAEEPLQPGDILVTGPANGGPGHAIIVGPDRFLWHSAHKKVVRAGLSALAMGGLYHKTTMRVKDRRGWYV